MSILYIKTFRGRIERGGGESKTVRVYIYAEYGGRELSNFIGHEVEGIIIVLNKKT